MTTYSLTTTDFETKIEAPSLSAAKRAARKALDDRYQGDRIRIYEHTETHGPVVVSTGVVGEKGWTDAR